MPQRFGVPSGVGARGVAGEPPASLPARVSMRKRYSFYGRPWGSFSVCLRRSLPPCPKRNGQAKRTQLSRSVRCSYHEQNSVSKAGGPARQHDQAWDGKGSTSASLKRLNSSMPGLAYARWGMRDTARRCLARDTALSSPHTPWERECANPKQLRPPGSGRQRREHSEVYVPHCER